MKKLLFSLFVLFLFTHLCINAQVTEVFNVTGPWGITVKDDVLYVGSNTESIVYKKDLIDTSVNPETYVQGINGASALTTIGDTLYIGERNGNRVSTYLLTEAGGDASSCQGFEFPPVGLGSKDGVLYIAEREGNKITTVNMNLGCGSGFSTVVNEIDQAYGLTLNGDILYGSDANGGLVFSLDLTDPNAVKETILDGLDTPAGLYAIDNTLYIAEFGGDRVAKVENIGPNQTVEFIQTGDGPLGLAADSSGNIYISEFTENRVSTFSIISNIDELDNEVPFAIYPNPSKNYIEVDGEGITDTAYRILSIDGVTVATGIYINGKQVDITELPIGTYTIHLHNIGSLQFQKQ
jgi:hypothetical protein